MYAGWKDGTHSNTTGELDDLMRIGKALLDSGEAESVTYSNAKEPWLVNRHDRRKYAAEGKKKPSQKKRKKNGKR